MSERDRVEVFAPATVANMGPGFDVLGLAVSGLGDRVVAERIEGPPGVELREITGDGGRLPTAIEENTATVAALGVALHYSIRVAITLHKGLPLASGLGSSAASSVAGAVAAGVLAGVDIDDDRASLLPYALAGEKVASGAAHADNAAPCLMGGAVLLHAPHANPPGLTRLPVPKNLWIALAQPQLALKTSDARAALPQAIPMASAVDAWGRVAGIVASFFRDDLQLLSDCLTDEIIEPARGPLIKGFTAVRDAALSAGGLACTISGAGPTLFAFAESPEKAIRVGRAMVEAWGQEGVKAETHIARPDLRGARVVE